MSRHTPAALVLTTLVLAALFALPSPADAQSPVPPVPDQTSHASVRQQISANPVGLLIDLFNIDYERRATDSVSIGLGGTTAKSHLNGDVYVRFYPRGTALEGLAFGVKIGLTQVLDQGSYFGYGFDVNKSSILGEHFYFGYGFGLKRLVGVDKNNGDLEYIPTLRLNVGVGF